MTATHSPLIEQGAAFMQVVESTVESYDVVVIGAGQAGLSIGYHLARQGVRFVIVDANERVGDSWRQRWDSLRLFTPARYDGLVGMPFPAPAHAFPTKDEMAEYLEAYAKRFELPIVNCTRVTRLWRHDGRYRLIAGNRVLAADHVVVAMADYQHKRVPTFANELDSEIVQLHSADYRNPGQLRDGDTLIVGAGNSGAEIALELSRDRHVLMSGRDTGQLPFRLDSPLGRHVFGPLVLRFLFHRVFTIKSARARKMSAKLKAHGGPLIRTRAADLAAAGVERVPRVAGIEQGRPRLDDGRLVDVVNVIWCTGFHPGFPWIDLPVFDEAGRPRHTSGVVDSEPGLYFLGLFFLHSASSVMIHGVGRDAERIAKTIARRGGQQLRLSNR